MEAALRWAARYSVQVPMEIRRHECGKPGHQAEPWLLLSVVTISDERLPLPLAARESNGRG